MNFNGYNKSWFEHTNIVGTVKLFKTGFDLGNIHK